MVVLGKVVVVVVVLGQAVVWCIGALTISGESANTEKARRAQRFKFQQREKRKFGSFPSS